MRFLTRRVCILATLIITSAVLRAQTVGIGTDYPTATLDIRTSGAMSSLNIFRMLAVSAGSTPAVRVRDVSDYIVMELEQQSPTNASEVLKLSTSGNGQGMFVDMKNSASASRGLEVRQTGIGDGMFVYLLNGTSSGDGVQIYTYGNNQNGIRIDNRGYSSWGMLNLLDDGVGVYNYFTQDDGVSVYTDMYNMDGSGYFYSNIDLAAYYGSGSIIGSGDGFALDVFVNTTTPSVGSTVYGAVIGGDQFGVGHGLLVNHNGTNGRNAEFNTTDPANDDPTIFATNSGEGSVIVGQQQNSSIGSVVSVADFSYTGTESLDHIAVQGFSAPAAGSGLGGRFTGGKYGVVGQEASGSSISAVHAVGDVSASGSKPFIIDHPLDPENKYLRHFAIESNEILNLYRGIVVIPRGGVAQVELPEYFAAINTDFSYQLTPIGSRQQPWIASEVSDRSFEIGGQPGSKVSWTLYAKRNDAYVRTHPQKTTNEFEKDAADRGRYLDPVSHGKPASMGIFYHPQEVLEPAHRELSKEAAQRYKAGRDRVTDDAKPGRHVLESANGDRSVSPEPAPMEIRQEVGTWDEIHRDE